MWDRRDATATGARPANFGEFVPLTAGGRAAEFRVGRGQPRVAPARPTGIFPRSRQIARAVMRTKRVVRLGLLATLVAAGLGSTGCEHMNNTEKGVGLGAATGAGVGLLAGAATGNPRTGAAVGGLVG